MFEFKLSNNYGTGLTGTCYGGISSVSDNTLNFTKVQNYSTNQTISQDKTLTLDVSDVTGEYYIKAAALHSASPSTYQFNANLYSIKLIK
ncbi:hypothetical protein D3C72_2188930 [compost metagenome]